MTSQGHQLLTKINAINDSYAWIEKQADDLMLEFEILMEKFESEDMEDADFVQLEQIEQKMLELEGRAKLNTKFYNASVDEAQAYFKQKYNADLPSSIKKII